MSLFIGVLSSAIFFLLGFATRSLYNYFLSRRPAMRVWKLARNAEVTIITASAKDRDDEEFTITVYPAEYTAATELAAFITGPLKCRVKKILAAADHPLDATLEDNMMVIGGPVHNRVTKLLLERMTIDYYFDGYSLVHRPTDERYNARDDGTSIVEDYGLIVLGKNPFNDRSRVILLMGCRTYGCIAAARMLIGDKVREVSRNLADTSEACLVVQTDVVGLYAGRPRLVVAAATGPNESKSISG